MAHKLHTCESCSKLCEEAKQNVKKLQKKVQILTIVCTSAVTLLGEQGGKALISSLNTVNSALSVVESKKTDDKENKKENEQHINPIEPLKGAWKPARNKSLIEQNKDNNTKKYDTGDELARLPTTKQEQNIGDIEPIVPENKIAKIVLDDQIQPLTIQPSYNDIPHFPDNFSLFYTPSLLPFDVYSNTLALGENYGFGDYYGINQQYIQASSVPETGTISIFALKTLINSRKRSI